MIVGAGVSTQFGLPLGGDLLTEIANKLKRELKVLQGMRYNNQHIQNLFHEKNNYPEKCFNQAPIINTKLCSLIANARAQSPHESLPSMGLIYDSFKGLEGLLRGQTADTIDDFIAQNPGVSENAKLAVGVDFFQKLYSLDSNSRTYLLKPIHSRMPSGQRNWVHLLINLVRQGIRLGKVSKDNPVKIITFNYDNILEFILEEQFSNTQMEMPNWQDVFQIHHVHGHMANLPKEVRSPFELCESWAESISVIHEGNIPEHIDAERDKARLIAANAKNIYVCGFGFSGANVRLLGLDHPTTNFHQRNIHYCNYAGNIGLNYSAKKLEGKRSVIKQSGSKSIQTTVDTKIFELSGSREKPMTITDWFYTGTPGELPS